MEADAASRVLVVEDEKAIAQNTNRKLCLLDLWRRRCCA